MSEEHGILPPDALRDFEIECEEHIYAARQTLVGLETVSDLAFVPQESLDVLFRAFHTIKGLAGMVGARSTEQAAHRVETFLSAIRDGNLKMSEATLEILEDAVTLLETSCTGFVNHQPSIDTSKLDERISLFLGDEAPNSPSRSVDLLSPTTSQRAQTDEKRSKLNAALLRGERIWNVMFTPSAPLAARGINVNSVREALQNVGEIVNAEPLTSAGGVQFRFLLATPSETFSPDIFGEGVTITPHEAPVQDPDSERPPIVAGTSSKLVRVELSRLDELMRAVADLVITRGRLQGGLARVSTYLPARERRELEETADSIEQQLRHLREGIMRVRMVPIRDLFMRMRLVVRDLTRENEKQLDLVFEGEGTEVDKLLVERMADPLLHLIRNAVSHGIEDADERRQTGKPIKGKITIRAAAAGGMIILEVEDDGRGVNVDDVFAKAKANGLIPPSTVADPTLVLDLLCSPGLSTRETADRVSGRGIGMDIVRHTVESLGGNLDLHFRPGQGTRFTCRLPLTLMVADVLTVSVGGRKYAVSKTLIREVVLVSSASITVTESHELIPYRNGVLPMLRLSDLFGATRAPGETIALITGEGRSAVAFAIDKAMGLHEVVVRALVDPLVQVLGFSGATDLGDGHPILILDPIGLTRIVRKRQIANQLTSGGLPCK